LRIVTAQLSPNWFAENKAPKGVVLIAPAMSVRQDYYATFAAFLAEQEYAVATFDYRYSGFNAPKTLRGVKLNFDDWANDLAQMIAACKERHPALPLIVFGHSLGGQLMGFAQRNHEVDALFTVGSGTGYWRHNHFQPLRLFYLWFIAMPLLTRLFGYFPGRRLKKVGDLSRDMALTWSRWCRHPDYYVDSRGNKMETRFADVRAPIEAWSFTDDDYIPKPACDQLHAFYVNAAVTRRHVSPAEMNEKRIGHFGFFKLPPTSPLWQELARALRQRIERISA
jgi:predicted alpha/beta hydrolase